MDLVISFFIVLYVLPRLLFFPDILSLTHQRSSEVTLRYLCCILDFFLQPLSVLSVLSILSLVLDAASAAKEFVSRPSQSRPPLSEVCMDLQLVWYQDGYLRQFSFKSPTSGLYLHDLFSKKSRGSQSSAPQFAVEHGPEREKPQQAPPQPEELECPQVVQLFAAGSCPEARSWEPRPPPLHLWHWNIENLPAKCGLGVRSSALR